jgi:uncharacterized protein (DUF2141 family)
MNHFFIFYLGWILGGLLSFFDTAPEEALLFLNIRTEDAITSPLVIVAYSNADDFLTERGTVLKTTRAQHSSLSFEVKGLDSGTYALVVFEDRNKNGVLDQNKLGIPQEPFGFSKAKLSLFGPPSFRKASFNFPEESEVDVVLKAF